MSDLPEVVTEDFKQLSETYGVEFLEWLKGAAVKGSDFIEEQAPLLARDIVNWELYSNGVFVVIGVSLVIFCICLWRYIYLNLPVIDWDYPTPTNFRFMALILLAISVTVGGFVCTFEHLKPTIKAAAAPRLVVLDYVQKFVK